MLRTRLLTATAAVALFAAGSAFAQTAPTAPIGPATTPPVAAEEPMDAPATAPAQAATNAAAPAQAAAVIANNVVDVLRANGQFTTLLGALDAAQLTETLSTQPAISIFAPTDAAFAALPEADRARLMDPANVNELRQVLLYHVVVADVASSQIEGAKGGVQTAATTEVQLDGTGDAIKVDNATVTTADVDAGNGSVFIIDRVLNPATSLVAAGDAEEAASPAAAPDATAAPADDTVTTPPVDDATDMDDASATDTMDADSAADAVVAPPPTAPAASTPPASAPTTAAPMTSAPMTSAPTPAAPTAPMTSPTAATPSTTAPARTGMTAPNGQPAASTTTVTSPTVPNPTDGQVDDEDADKTPTPPPAPRPQA